MREIIYLNKIMELFLRLFGRKHVCPQEGLPRTQIRILALFCDNHCMPYDGGSLQSLFTLTSAILSLQPTKRMTRLQTIVFKSSQIGSLRHLCDCTRVDDISDIKVRGAVLRI